MTHKQGPSGLSALEAEILNFERKWWKYAGSKERAVQETFGFSMTQYFQILNDLIDRPEALAVAPMVVLRLRRMRDQRRGQVAHGQ